jgi:hypothetical protein
LLCALAGSLGTEFRATDVVSERGDEAVARVRELTDGLGAHSVLECVGLEQSTLTALHIARPVAQSGASGCPKKTRFPTVTVQDDRYPERLEQPPAAETPHTDQRRRITMTPWTSDELDRIGEAEELEIASVRRDGTQRKPVTIWVVRHGDDLYIRSVNGRTSSWFRGAQARQEAHIEAGGVDKDVLLVEADDLNDKIDAAYRSK